VALLRKETRNLRHPMHLRHPVSIWFNNITYIFRYILCACDVFSRRQLCVDLCICALFVHLCSCCYLCSLFAAHTWSIYTYHIYFCYLCICAFVTICAHSLRPTHEQYIPTTYTFVICAFVRICALVTICAHSLRPTHEQYIPATCTSVICAFVLLSMCGPQRVSAYSNMCVCVFVSVYPSVCVHVSISGPQRVSANNNLISYVLVRDA